MAGDTFEELLKSGAASAAGGRWARAAAEFARAVALDPSAAAAHYNLGVALQKLGRLDDAAAALREAVRLAPSLAAAHNSLGSVLRDAGAPEEALAGYRRAAELAPADARYAANVGTALHDLGRVDEAVASFDHALRLDPDYARGRAHRALSLLLAGDYARGLADYEARPVGQTAAAAARGPAWDGSDPSGKTIQLHGEQGLGDTIQFVRYAPLLAARGATVAVQCPAPLVRLLRESLPPRGVSGVFAEGEPPPSYDVHCPLPGLPYRFGTRVKTIPADVPYLAAPADRVAAWRARAAGDAAAPAGRALRVGLVWAGGNSHPNDRRRSAPLAAFEPLAAVPGVRLYSLQKGERAAALRNAPGWAPQDWGAAFDDFADTAAAIESLDLVISVDTSVAHLAGALGRPVWTLLPFAPDWRWLLGRADSPWYPTMRLFRQPRPGDWSAVVRDVQLALTEVAARRGDA